ncbi:MAG: hypothetical protein K8R76_05355 [Candidatus Aegiribacteria sp.]|nr:hypothetical protein [Candidatus Aegiribacteria sp.]
MNARIYGIAAGVTVLLIAMSCGNSPCLQDELEMVPGLCFLHAHMSADFNVELLPVNFSTFIPVWLCDSLLSRGDLGISLLSINLSDLSPQLLFLSSSMNADEMTHIAREGFDCNSAETGDRIDLISDQGSVLGSISDRNGWTCLVTGTGSDRAVDRWLSLEPVESLASDTDLIIVADSEADLTVLFSNNSISFLSVLPDGMFSRSERRILANVRNLVQSAGLKALRISLDFIDANPPVTVLEIKLIRGDDYISSLSISFSDTGISPDSLIQEVLLELLPE